MVGADVKKRFTFRIDQPPAGGRVSGNLGGIRGGEFPPLVGQDGAKETAPLSDRLAAARYPGRE
jgi:hypothetical protein